MPSEIGSVRSKSTRIRLGVARSASPSTPSFVSSVLLCVFLLPSCLLGIFLDFC